MRHRLCIALVAALLCVLFRNVEPTVAERADDPRPSAVRSSAAESLRTVAACNADLHLPAATAGLRPIVVRQSRTADRTAPSRDPRTAAGTTVAEERPTLRFTGGLYRPQAVATLHAAHAPQRLCRWII